MGSLKISEMMPDALEHIIFQEFNQILILNNQSTTEHAAETNASKLGEFFRLRCKMWTEETLRTFFSDYISGELGKIYKISYASITDAVKVFKSRLNELSESKGTQNNNDFVDYLYSDTHRELIAKSIARGIPDSRCYYSMREMENFDQGICNRLKSLDMSFDNW